MTVTKRLAFMVAANPQLQDCAPWKLLNGLLALGWMPRLQSIWGTRRADCHEIAVAILSDISDCKPQPDLRFDWMTADCNVGPHSWLESDGWAIDASNGIVRAPFVAPASIYRSKIGAANMMRVNRPNHLNRNLAS
jgi:hypothetical protein